MTLDVSLAERPASAQALVVETPVFDLGEQLDLGRRQIQGTAVLDQALSDDRQLVRDVVCLGQIRVLKRRRQPLPGGEGDVVRWLVAFLLWVWLVWRDDGALIR